MHQLSYWFPELEALIGLGAEPAQHPEGDVWTHTMQVLDEAALLRERGQRTSLVHALGSVSRFRKGVRPPTENGGACMPTRMRRQDCPWWSAFSAG